MAGGQAGEADMLPEQVAFIRGNVGVPCALDDAIARHARSGRVGAVHMSVGSGIITGQRFVFVLVAIDEERNIPEIGRKILDLGTVDQLLARQHPAQQQADNDQDDGDFDKGEAFLLVFHGMLRLEFLGTFMQVVCLSFKRRFGNCRKRTS